MLTTSDCLIFKFNTGEENYELTFTRSAKDVKAYLKAITNGDIIIVNSFPSSYIPESKAFLALLSGNSTLRHALASHEIALIDRLVPWTRVVHLLSEDERAEVLRNKAEYVLKQAYDTRGRTVVIGATTSRAYFILDGKACCPFPRTARSNVSNIAQGGALVVPLRMDIR